MTSERTDLQAEHPSNVFPTALTTPTEPHGHAAPQRGVDVLPSSSFRSGRFGRMFRSVPVFELDDLTPLRDLGASMTVDTDTVDDWESFEHPGLPAGYTYLGQFIDHDITFDPISSLQRQNDPDALHNFRTPKFDLDSLYGGGPSDATPFLYLKRGRDADPQGPTGSAMVGSLCTRLILGSGASSARYATTRLQS